MIPPPRVSPLSPFHPHQSPNVLPSLSLPVSAAHQTEPCAKIRPRYLDCFQHALNAQDGSQIRLRGDQEESVTNDFSLLPLQILQEHTNRLLFPPSFFFLILEKAGGGGGPKKSNAYNRFMKSELKKLKEEFPDLGHVERSVRRPRFDQCGPLTSFQVQDGSCELAQEEGRERSRKVQRLNDLSSERAGCIFFVIFCCCCCCFHYHTPFVL